MTIRLIAILCLGLLQTAPALAQSAAAPKDVPASRDAKQTPGRAAPCTATTIEAAVEKHVAPDVVGCNIKDVTAPLLRTKILPALEETNNTAAFGIILTQRPAAGSPLKPGGQLSLQISTGKAPAEESPAAASSAAPEKPVEKTPASPVAPEPVSSPAQAQPSTTTKSAEPLPALPTHLTPAHVDIPEQPWWAQPLAFVTTYPLAVLIGLGVLITVGVLSMRGKTGRKSSKVLPKVTGEIAFTPGRLVKRGPLILGEKGND